MVLTDNFWLPKIQLIQDSTIRYAFDKCAEEGRMENFLIAGGVKKGKTRGKMPFDDTDLYKIIEGASYSLISKPNPTLDAYLDSVINIIGIGTGERRIPHYLVYHRPSASACQLGKAIHAALAE